MARLLNIIGQIIHLSKIAKRQVKKGKYSSVKRIFEIMLKIEKKELKFFRDELGSEEFYEECVSIYEETKKDFKGLSRFNPDKVLKLLDRIIFLETYEFKNIVKAKLGIQKNILSTVDPYIRELVNEINKLSFVKKTHFSCSGHFPYPSQPYIEIEYDWESRTKHNIKYFHNQMIGIVSEAVFRKPISGKKGINFFERVYRDIIGIRRIIYYLGFHIEIPTKRAEEEYKNQFRKQWNQIFRLVKKFQDNDTLEYKNQRTYIKKNPSVLGKPKELIQRGIIVQCPKCRSYMITKNAKPICERCGYIIGNIIS